jgi:hypothetical protein
MSRNNYNSEKGQVIVYLVLGLVVFLAFVALAIDGGMALSDRRNVQNAADAASLAGGGTAATILANLDCPAFFTCGNGILGAAESAAIDRAEQNNFIIDDDFSDHNGVDAKCINTSTDKYIEVTVDTAATTQSNFLQLVYPNALRNELEAITHAYPGGPIGTDAAVIALNPADCSGDNGIKVSGNGTITVSGGGMFSNGCVQGGGTPASAVVLTGTIEYAGDVDIQNTFFNPDPIPASDSLEPDDYYIPPPKLDASGNCIGGQNVNSIPKNMVSNTLYCLKGSDTINKDTTGIGVTIYLANNAHLTVNGGADVHLEASTDPHASPEIPHVLIYAANGASITINGDSKDVFIGLIYAPDSPSQITLNGNAENIFIGQVIGWNVKINGTNLMSVVYEKCNGYLRPPSLDLYK